MKWLFLRDGSARPHLHRHLHLTTPLPSFYERKIKREREKGGFNGSCLFPARPSFPTANPSKTRRPAHLRRDQFDLFTFTPFSTPSLVTKDDGGGCREEKEEKDGVTGGEGGGGIKE